MMTDDDPNITEFRAFKPQYYGYLRTWLLERSQKPENQDGTRLTIELQSEKPDASAIAIQCADVIEVHINSLNKLNDYLIDISPVNDKQWDDGNYYVAEINHDAFSFVCKEFRIRRVGYKGDKEKRAKKFCSFCAKSKEEVKTLIAAARPDVFICNECISLCVDILSGGERQK